MGAFFQSVAIPTRSPDDVRTLITTWLAAKGFEPRPEPPLFDCDAETERGLCLFANEGWVVVLYSHMDTEGPRLLHELGKLNRPLLRIWVHDSDLWGYDLHQDEELVASFHSDPHYFGYPEEPSLPVDGDPALLCELCPVEAGADAIARIQRGRALFKEVICRRFCMAIGAAPAGLGYRDIEEMNLPATASVPASGFHMQQWFFVERGYGGHEESLSLHALTFAFPDEPAAPEELPPEWHDYMRAMRFRIKIIQILLWPLLLAISLLVKLYLLLYRTPFLRRFVMRQPLPADEGFFLALRSLSRPSFRVEGHSLINDRHHCRIDLPEDAEPHPGQSPRWLFHFQIGQVNVLCHALRPREARAYFRLPGRRILIEDEKFFAGSLPARAMVQSFAGPNGVIYQYLYLVQTEQAYYLFSTVSMQELAAETRALLRETIDSFRLIP